MASPIIKQAGTAVHPVDFPEMQALTHLVVSAKQINHAPPTTAASHLDRRVIRGPEARYEARPLVLVEITPHREADEYEPVPAPAPPSHEEELALREAAWEQRLAEEVETARREAYALGRQEAEAELGARMEEERQALLEDTSRLKQLWKELAAKSEPLMLEMMLDLLEAILHQPLPEPMVGIVENTLLSTLEVFSRETPIRLSLNSIDYLRLQERGLVAQMSTLFPRLVWDPQPELREGDWIAQSPDQMVRSIVSEAIHHIKDAFGLLEPHSRTARLAPAPRPEAE